MANVNYFEIGVDDLDAAVGFYSKIFGWTIEKADDGSDYWYITTGDEEDPGIAGGLTNRFDEWNPTINHISVPSLDSCARQITEAGGKVLTTKTPFPGGFYQYCQDPEGNVFAIAEYDDEGEEYDRSAE